MPTSLLVDTPEQHAIRLPIAGHGTRSLAFLVDAAIRYGASLLLFLIAQATADWTAHIRELHGSTLAAVTLAFFFAQWLYPVAFEAFAGGRTPGKRLFGLRVVGVDGRLPGLGPVALRNLLRVLDLLPGFYLLGHFSILCTEKCQRLGDVIAQTVVVDERARRNDVPVATSGWIAPRTRQWESELESRRSRLAPQARARLDELLEQLNVAIAEAEDTQQPEPAPIGTGRP
ncbi:MAG: RDD family protein [Planctomycetota bacterium]